MEENQKVKIVPIIVEQKEVYKLYEFLLNNEYSIKIFDKKKNSNIYKYFLPVIRDFLFWTFNLKGEKKFKSMSKEMQAAVCNNYSGIVFENGDNLVIAFHTGIAFIVSNTSKEIEKIKKYNGTLDINKINIDENKYYRIETAEEVNFYSYILTLYKYVFLSKINKELENKDHFDKNRQEFVKFVQEIYTQRITDYISGNKLMSDWEQKLQLDKLYIAVENKFDLLYRNIKLDDHNTIFRIIIILLVVLIIIGTINLGNFLV